MSGTGRALLVLPRPTSRLLAPPPPPSTFVPLSHSLSLATYLVGENDARSRYRVAGSPPLVAELVAESAQRQRKGLDG